MNTASSASNSVTEERYDSDEGTNAGNVDDEVPRENSVRTLDSPPKKKK